MNKTHEPVEVRHNYFSRYAIMDPQGTVTMARKRLKGVDFDTFVVTGDSGLAVGVLLAWKMGKSLVVIRKPGAQCHDWENFYGEIGSRWLFLDDLVETGDTRTRVIKDMSKIIRDHEISTVYVGQYEYANRYNRATGKYQNGLFTESTTGAPTEYACCEECG